MLCRVAVLLAAALAAVGCAEPLQLVVRPPTAGVSPCFYWPPPPSSALWLSGPTADPNSALSSVASRVELDLRAAGYVEQRWYPIGTRHDHGFAVTTRLERVDQALRIDDRERWTSRYRDAANLKWLTQARALPLPKSGHYRVLLIAFTDLPIGPTSIAPRWREETMMDGPGAPESFSARESAIPARLPRDYQFGIYEYEYQWNDGEARALLRTATPLAAAELPRAPARLAELWDSATPKR